MCIGGGYVMKNKKKLLCSSKMNFWAYHSCGDADVHDQTASEDIETVTRGEQTEIWNLGGGR